MTLDEDMVTERLEAVLDALAQDGFTTLADIFS